MRESDFRKVVALVSLVAFMAASVVAVLPHSHPTGMRGYDCLICRAQSVQPSVEPQISAPTPTPILQGIVVGEAVTLFSQGPFLPFSSRAPPVPA